MDGQSIANLITALGVVASIVLGALNMRSQQKLAQAAADRAEAAGRVSADNTEKVISALEKMAETAEILVKQPRSGVLPPAPAKRARWRLEHFKGDTYQLTNIGNATAANFEIGAHESLIFRGPESPIVLRPDEAATFLAAASLATHDKTITVRWNAEDGTTTDWKYPLPPKP
ncbi:hypothetical protein M1D93_17160 [Arthrobacter sp. Z1-9]